jgi:type IV secretory pathway TraG/TraD family ATPase VirD4
MSAVVQWVHAGRLDAAEHVLRETKATSAAAVIRGIAQTPDRERGSIWSAVSGGLAPFDDSSVLASADRAAHCGFTTAEFLGRPDSVFIVAPSDDATPLAPLVVGLVEEIRAEALQISNVAGALDLPLLLALDEIATICPLPSLPQIAAEGGGRNVLLLAVLQDFSQAAARWGREVADGLLTLAGTKLVLPGVADTDTLQRIEALAGKHWVHMISTSKMQGGGFWRDTTWGTQRSEMELPRHPAASVRELAPGTGLLLSGRSRAMRIRLIGRDIAPFRQWHADARRAANL